MRLATIAWLGSIERGNSQSHGPNESERRLSEKLVAEHGLSALCRGLFNVNEFVVLE